MICEYCGRRPTRQEQEFCRGCGAPVVAAELRVEVRQSREYLVWSVERLAALMVEPVGPDSIGQEALMYKGRLMSELSKEELRSAFESPDRPAFILPPDAYRFVKEIERQLERGEAEQGPPIGVITYSLPRSLWQRFWDWLRGW
ncbi:MAG: hypothetical protein KIT46_04615 [Anaerolineales bacterium]|nr:hypothetical protein [Anaerolineales bacterium]MCW5855313.1 hypothetical protein [Anaerolineales bacterium]